MNDAQILLENIDAKILQTINDRDSNVERLAKLIIDNCGGTQFVAAKSGILSGPGDITIFTEINATQTEFINRKYGKYGKFSVIAEAYDSYMNICIHESSRIYGYTDPNEKFYLIGNVFSASILSILNGSQSFQNEIK